jgi:hypothetical protein
MLKSMLGALANPARPGPIPREGAATPQVHGQALCELLERYPIDGLPTTGGVNATVVVVMSLETLMGGLKAARVLGTDTLVSPSLARRLACAAGVIPAVLDGDSEPVDLGRRRRRHSKPQRLAMALREDGLCNISGCDECRNSPPSLGDHRTPGDVKHHPGHPPGSVAGDEEHRLGHVQRGPEPPDRVLADQLLLGLLGDLLVGSFGDDRLRGDAVRSHARGTGTQLRTASKTKRDPARFTDGATRSSLASRAFWRCGRRGRPQ